MEIKDGQLLDALAELNPMDQPDFDQLSSAMAVTFTRIAENDPEQLWRVLYLWPNDLLQLAPWLPEIGGTFPPERFGWHEWIGAATAF